MGVRAACTNFHDNSEAIPTIGSFVGRVVPEANLEVATFVYESAVETATQHSSDKSVECDDVCTYCMPCRYGFKLVACARTCRYGVIENPRVSRAPAPSTAWWACAIKMFKQIKFEGHSRTLQKDKLDTRVKVRADRDQYMSRPEPEVECGEQAYGVHEWCS